MVFTSKSERDLYVCMSSAMSTAEFSKLTKSLYRALPTTGDYLDEIPQWSFLQLFSYLAYATTIPVKEVQYSIYRILKKYLPDQVLKEWKEIIQEQRENIQDDTVMAIQKMITEGS